MLPFRSLLPPIFAVLILTFAWAFRGEIAAPLASIAAERVLNTRLSARYEVTINSIAGSFVDQISAYGVEVSARSQRGVLRSARIAVLSFDYSSIFAFAPKALRIGDAAVVMSSRSAPDEPPASDSSRVRTGVPDQSGVPGAEINSINIKDRLATALEGLPEGMSVDLSADLRYFVENGRELNARLTVSGRIAGDTRILVELPGNQPALPWGEPWTVMLAVRTSSSSLLIDTVADRTSVPLSLSAAVRVPDSSLGELSVNLRSPELQAALDATGTSTSGEVILGDTSAHQLVSTDTEVQAADEQPSGEPILVPVLEALTPRDRIRRIGAAHLWWDLTIDPSVAETNDIPAVGDLRGQAGVTAENWHVAGLPVDELAVDTEFEPPGVRLNRFLLSSENVAKIGLNGAIHVDEGRIEVADFDAEVVDLSRLKPILGGDSLGGTLVVKGDLAVPFAEVGWRQMVSGARGSLSLTASKLTVPGLPIDAMEGEIDAGRRGVTIRRLHIQGESGSLSMKGVVSVDEDGISAVIGEGGIQWSGLEGRALEANLSSEATISYGDAITANVPGIDVLGGAVAFEGSLVQDRLSGEGTISEVDLAAVSTFADIPTKLGGVVGGSLSLGGTRSNPEMTFDFSSDTVSFDEVTGEVSASGRVSVADDSVSTSFEGGLQATDGSTARFEGSIQLPTGQTSPSRESATVEAHLQFGVPVDHLTRFSSAIVTATGRADGELTVEGTVNDPDLYGEVSVTEGSIGFGGDVPTVRALEATFEFVGRQLEILEATGELGYAPFGLEGSVTLPGSSAGVMELSATGENVLLVSTPDMRVRADVDLRATGEIQGPSLTGTVVVRNTEYTRDTALLSVGGPAAVETPGFQLFQVPGEFARNTSISLSVRGNESIEVHNNLFQGAVSTDLELGGTLAVPVPAGRVSTEDSVLLLPLTTIDIEQAQLRFPRSNPFEPTISGRGSARIRGHDLRVIASGTLPDVEVEVSSDPPLPQDEALILLTTGRTPDSLAESGASLGTLLGEQLIRNLTGPRQEGGLQQVDVRIGENISPEGVESLEVGFNLGEEDRWYLVFKRSQEERYSLDLAWRFWFQ